MHRWCPPPNSAGLVEAAGPLRGQEKNRAYQAGRFPAGQSQCDQTLSSQALKGRRRHVGTSAAQPLTALDPLDQEKSRKFQLWTFLWMFLWTSTAHCRGHDHLQVRLDIPQERLVYTVAEAVERPARLVGSGVRGT
jgi:hypothetical protein